MKKYFGILSVLTNAYTLAVNLVDYKADYLGDPHETAKQTKTITFGQFVNVDSTTVYNYK